MSKITPILRELTKEENIQAVQNAANTLIVKYTDSPYHTNAGRILRFIVKIIPVSFILRLLQAKVNK